jgi:hypothetical protein
MCTPDIMRASAKLKVSPTPSIVNRVRGDRMVVAERKPACDAAGPYDVILDEERRRPKKRSD